MDLELGLLLLAGLAGRCLEEKVTLRGDRLLPLPPLPAVVSDTLETAEGLRRGLRRDELFELVEDGVGVVGDEATPTELDAFE